MSETVRNASQPAAGAVRTGVAVTLASAIAEILSNFVPEVAPVKAPSIVILSALFSLFGKVARNKGHMIGEVV